jgi:serine/threonine protein phosphatase 1
MNYVISDIHGHYEEYLKLLKQVNFKESDNLYVLGDVVDRGPEPVKVLQDMMMRVNVFPLLGNHDYFAMRFLMAMQKPKGISGLPAQEQQELKIWIQDGGAVTAKQIMELDEEEREDLLDYMEEFLLYAQVKAGRNRYVLVHAGLDHFSPDRALEDYHYSELIYREPDYDQVYFKDQILVTGHRPTFKIDEKYRGMIMEKNNHVAIDCGAAYGERLGAYCLETGKQYYVDIEEQ